MRIVCFDSQVLISRNNCRWDNNWLLGEKRVVEEIEGSVRGWEPLRERLHESIVLKNSRYERAMFSARSLVPRESAHNAIEERTTSDKNMGSCLHLSREVLELFAGITNPNKLDSNLFPRPWKSNLTSPIPPNRLSFLRPYPNPIIKKKQTALTKEQNFPKLLRRAKKKKKMWKDRSLLE